MSYRSKPFFAYLKNRASRGFWGLAISTLSVLLSVAAASAGTVYRHGTAGFTADLPAQWALRTTERGLELSIKTAFLSIENIGITAGEATEVMALFVPGNPGKPISQPYPGLRSSFQENGYTAEVAVLKTPVGFFLLSLEQAVPDSGNLQVFEETLNSFKLLETPPAEVMADSLQPVRLGPVDISVPAGDVATQNGGVLWKSGAGGLLIGDVVKLGAGQTLSSLLGQWETSMLGADTGLTARTATLDLTVGDRPVVQADYSGDKMLARVQVSAVDRQSALVLALIARQEVFASHQQVLDLVSFSIAPADKHAPPGPSQQTASRENYSDVVLAVSEQTGLDTDAVSKLYKSKPGLFDGIRKTLETFNSLAAGDLEMLAQSVQWQDSLSNAELLRPFHAALRSYKVSLGLLPKDFKPGPLPNELVNRYMAAHKGQTPTAAYHYILAQNDFPERREFYGHLLKAKGQSQQDAPPKLLKYLQGKTDLFWRNRLEVAYQQRLFRERKQEVIEALWHQRSEDLQKIRDAVR